MSHAPSREIRLPSEAATTKFGASLARLLTAGDTVLLSGSIGAGKTHLARAIIKSRLAAIGRDEDVPSPTFTLTQTYDDGLCEIWHADLYRLTNADEIIELGIEDAFETSIVLIEWPDRLGDNVPADALHINLSSLGEGRTAKIAWTSPRWGDVLSEITQDAA